MLFGANSFKSLRPAESLLISRVYRRLSLPLTAVYSVCNSNINNESKTLAFSKIVFIGQ